MKKYFALFLTLGLILSVAIISCKKENTSTNNVINVPYHGPTYSTSLAGLGIHPGYPTGSAFTLPSFIKIVGHMYGGFPGKVGVQFPKTPKGLQYLLASMPKSTYTSFGYGTYVNIYVKFANTSHSPYNLIIPAGTLMQDSLPNGGDTTQGGVIIVPDTIPIIDTTPCLLKSFCTNLHHPAPDFTHHYQFAVVSNNNQIMTMVNILRYKKTLAAHISEIQSYIWEITDGAGLTETDINTMNSWQ